MKKPIRHSRPTVGEEELYGLRKIMSTAQVGGGREVEQFEHDLSRLIGVRHTVAVNSGSAALHLALLSLNVGPGDSVILPTYCCSAVLNAVLYTGARPVLVDVLLESGNINPAAVRKALSRQVKAVLVPHMFGMPADIQAVRRFGVPIIEDCAMSIGGTVGKTRLGAWGDLSVFSFYATKVMTTGTGGAVATSRKDLWTRILDLVDYDNRDTYAVRYNYKMSAVAAAMGRAQLKKLPEFLKRRQRIAEFYYRSLPFPAEQLPPRHPGRIYYRFVVRTHDDSERWIRFMKSRGIECKRPVYRPLHQYFKELRTTCPVADEVHRCSLSIPMYPALTNAELTHVSNCVKDYYK